MPFFLAVIQQMLSLKFEVILEQVEVQINSMKISRLPRLVLITRVLWRSSRVG